LSVLHQSEEILEVVDEHDRVIGLEHRGVIHAEGLMHRSAQVLVFNSDGHLFIQKRSAGKDEFPGLWDCSAAGHVNPGESYRQCAQREVEEELGIVDASGLERMCSFPASADTGFEHCTVFRCFNDGPMTLQAEEIEEGRWLSPQEMDEWVADPGLALTPSLCSIWRTVRGRI
jgi:isopentenyl-diphosphate delta-isomerase type 1